MAVSRVSASSLGLGVLRSESSGPLAPTQRLRRLVALEREDLVVVVVYAVAIGLMSLAVPVAAQSLVNTVAFTALLQPLVVLSFLVFGGLSIAGILRALQYRVVETLQQRFFVRLAHDSVRRLTRSDLRAFSERSAPEIVNRFFDVVVVQKAAATLLLDGLSVVLQGAVSLVLLAFYHPALLAFDVVLLAAIAVILVGLGRGGVASAMKESKAKYAAASWLEQVAAALRTFKPASGDAFAFERVDDLARSYVEARRKHFRVIFRQTVAAYALQAVATAVLLGLGGTLVIQGQLTLGQLVAAELIVTGILLSVAKCGKYLESYYDLCASLDKVGHIVDLPPEREDGLVRGKHDGPARLSLDKLAFSYGEGAPVFENLSFDLAAGAAVAILGGEASGKSSLVDVLYGLRVPSAGRVLLDGVDLRTLALADLRRDVAVVGTPEIVDGTVIDNLALGHVGVDAETAEDVLVRVGLAEDIGRFPEGAATRVGHRGDRLTSSQSARLAVARALVAKPRLLILDEALDALGAETVRKVLRGIASGRPAVSLIVLTRRDDVAAAVGTTLGLNRPQEARR